MSNIPPAQSIPQVVGVFFWWGASCLSPFLNKKNTEIFRYVYYDYGEFEELLKCMICGELVDWDCKPIH